MALFRKLFYRKPPDGLLEISERVYVFDCCFTTDTWKAEDYKVYTGGIVGQLREHFPDASILVFNFRDEQARSQMGNILSEYDMTIMDYPRHYEGCPVLKMEVIHHFLRSCESWLSLGQQNVLLMHCEQGGWPVLAFMLAALLIYRKQFTGEQRTLDMVYKQAPRELLVLLCPLNPISSQLRYLQYVSRRNVASEWPPADRALNLDCVILRLIPNFDGEGGCRPMFRIYGQDPHVDGDKASKILYSTPKKGKALRTYKQAECELVKLDISCHVQGDVLLECISIDGKLEREVIMFRVMFNTAFIRSNILMLNRDEIDTQWDEKDRFPKDFRAEILFSEIDAAASVVAMDFPCFEEKEGLPIEAFAKVKEIFSHVDWLDPKADVSLDMLQHIGVSSIVHEMLDPQSPRGLQIGSSQETSPNKILEKCRIVESSAKVSLSSYESVPSTKLSADSVVCENSEPQRSQIERVNSTNQSLVDSPQHAVTYALPTMNSFQSASRDDSLPSNTKPLSPSHVLSENTYETHSVTVLPDMPQRASPISPSIPSVSKGPAVGSSPSPVLPPAPDIMSEAILPHVTATVKDDLSAKPRCPSPSAAVSHVPPPSPPLDQSEDLGAKPPLEQDIALASPPPPSAPLKKNLGVRPKPPPLPPSATASPVPPPPPPPPPPPLKEDSGVIPFPPHELYTSSTRSPTLPTERGLSVRPQAHTTPSPLPGTEIASSMTSHPPTLPKRESFPHPPPLPPAPAVSLPVPVLPPPPPRPPPLAGSSVSSSMTSYPPPLARPSVRDYSSGKVQAPQPPPPPPVPLVASPVKPAPPPPPDLPARETLSSKPGPPPPPPPPLRSGQAPGPSNSTPVPPPPPPVNPSNVPLAPPPPFSLRGIANSTGSLRNSGPQNNSSNGAKGRLSRTISARSNQMKKLKPLHWLKLTRAVQGSLWADAQKFGEASNAPEIDMSELESLFSAAVPNLDNSRSGLHGSQGPKSEKVQLVDHRRAYNCEIMLSKVKVPLQDLMSSVLALEDTALDVDQVDNLIKFCPTKEEMELLKGYNGDREKLGKCEQFFYELMKVPRVETKLRVFSFKMQFRSQVSDLRNSLCIVKSVAEEIRSSVKLKKIMQTILSLGNALNQGTARGSAVGFRLDSLLKLTDTRARNNKMTLMHYLCKVLGEKMPELLDFPNDLPNLEPASKIQLKFLAEEMQAINKGLERVIQELSSAENDGPVSETFCKNLKEFLRFAEAEVRSLASLYSGVGRNVDALIVYFGEDPARCPFEQVISTLLNFTRNFKRAHEENCKQHELEMKKTAEAEKLKSKETEKLTPPTLVKSSKPKPRA